MNVSKLAGRYNLLEWELTAGSEPESCSTIHFSEMSVQVSGDFDGGSVVLEGSLDKENYTVITDTTGLPMAFSGDYMAKVGHSALSVRPKYLGGPNGKVLMKILCKGAG